MHENLNPQHLELTADEIINNFTEKFSKQVKIIDFLDPKLNLPEKEDILLLHHNCHYNVIRHYQ
jgi:hypothetical protein